MVGKTCRAGDAAFRSPLPLRIVSLGPVATVPSRLYRRPQDGGFDGNCNRISFRSPYRRGENRRSLLRYYVKQDFTIANQRVFRGPLLRNMSGPRRLHRAQAWPDLHETDCFALGDDGFSR